MSFPMEALCQFSHGISQQPKVMADSENFKCCIAGFLRYITYAVLAEN